jgi:nucleotide-binding universal stress UspA family protein
VLVPLDGSELAEDILSHAIRIARLEGAAELVLLRVIQPLSAALWLADPAVAPAVVSDLRARAEEEARTYLAGLVRRLEGDGVRARARVDEADGVASRILEVAREEAAELVALATHGRSGLVRLALGSVADKVVRGSPVPVLLHRPAPRA